MNVLVLGWEYPPVVAGGLGAACFGLTTALAARGHRVLLVVPKCDGAGGVGNQGSGLRGGDRFADGPGIQRLEVDLSPDPAGEVDVGANWPLSPYARVAPDHSESPGEGDDTAASAPERVDAQDKLYGRDLHIVLERYAARVEAAVGGQPFDVIHAHDWMTVPAAARLRMGAGHAPLCLHVHSTAFDRSGDGDLRDPVRRVEAAGIRTADRVLAVSEYGREVILDQYRPDPARVVVVHNAGPAMDGDLLSKVPAGHGASPPTALFLGRLTRQKGASFFLRAAALVCESRPDARFVIAGDGEDRKRLVEESAELGIARNVFFTGSIDDECRDREYRDASVFVLSSLSEPFGLTPLEALRQGTPVILSEQSGVREVLPSAPHVAPWDRRALAGAIERVFADPAYARGLVAEGCKDLMGVDWAASAAVLEATLGDAIRTNGRVARHLPDMQPKKPGPSTERTR